MSGSPREAMLACAADPHGDIGAAALWLAAEDVSGVEVPRWLEVLDQLGDELRARGAPKASAGARATVMGSLFTDRLNLHGAGAGDPRAHYLHSVLERGAGVPISCGVVWMAVGRRAGLDVQGIGLPGHFAVRVEGCLIDAFSGGDPLDADAVKRLIAASAGIEPVELDPAWMRPLTTAAVLARMSRNLGGCYASMNQWPMALRSADRCVALLPEQAGERRDRGMLHRRLGHAGLALNDLLAYLELAPPGAADRGRISEIVNRLRSYLN